MASLTSIWSSFPRQAEQLQDIFPALRHIIIFALYSNTEYHNFCFAQQARAYLILILPLILLIMKQMVIDPQNSMICKVCLAIGYDSQSDAFRLYSQMQLGCNSDELYHIRYVEIVLVGFVLFVCGCFVVVFGVGLFFNIGLSCDSCCSLSKHRVLDAC